MVLLATGVAAQFNAGIRFGITNDREHRKFLYPVEATTMLSLSEDGRLWFGVEGGGYLSKREERTTTYGPWTPFSMFNNATVTTIRTIRRGDLAFFFQYRLNQRDGRYGKNRSLYFRLGPAKSWSQWTLDYNGVSTTNGAEFTGQIGGSQTNFIMRHVVGYEWNRRIGVWCIEALAEAHFEPQSSGYGLRLGYAWRTLSPIRWHDDPTPLVAPE